MERNSREEQEESGEGAKVKYQKVRNFLKISNCDKMSVSLFYFQIWLTFGLHCQDDNMGKSLNWKLFFVVIFDIVNEGLINEIQEILFECDSSFIFRRSI